MNTLVAAVGFRNVLAHEYGKVDHVEVYETLQTGWRSPMRSVGSSLSGPGTAVELAFRIQKNGGGPQ